MTTSAHLLPLAPKTALNATMSGNNGFKPMPLRAPHSASAAAASAAQSLLLYPDVLVRATITESLRNLTAPPANPLVFNHQQMKQQLHRQLLHIQKLQQAGASPGSGAASAQQDIIGMGICIPNPLASAPAPCASATAIARTSTSTARPTAPATSSISTTRKTHSESVRKMMMYGKPLQAPPPLCTGIVKRRAVVPQDALSNKRRKLGTPAPLEAPPRTLTPPVALKKTLTSEELEFLQAAQRLHEIHSATTSVATSPLSSPATLSPQTSPLTSKALRAPPCLGL